MVTRPVHQAAHLAEGIKMAGGEPFIFPTISILPTPLSTSDKKRLQDIKQFDIIVFISPNAVEFGLNHIVKLPENTRLATIGGGSAKALEKKLGRRPDISPKENFNSEGLLATPEMQDVQNKHILIIRGQGGREHLKQTLEQRGADVEYLNVYQREKPKTNSHDYEQYLQNNELAAIVITSAESLKNLLALTPKEVRPQLLRVPLMLINQRIVSHAKEAGFGDEIYLATQASDDAIIKALEDHHLISPTNG